MVNGDVAHSLRTLVARDLSVIVSGPPIYLETRFKGIELTPKAKKCIGKLLHGPALERFHRLLLECALPGILRRHYNGNNQVRVRVGIGLFRIIGENGIHGKKKINGKDFSKKLTQDNDVKKAKAEYEKWVVTLRNEQDVKAVKKGTARSHVQPYLESRSIDVDAGEIKEKTLTDLGRKFDDLEAH